jgi:hypothetical protein
MNREQALELIDRRLKSSDGGRYGYDPIGDLASREQLEELRAFVASAAVQN